LETAMLGELRAKEPALLAAIRDEREISPAVEKGLGDFLDGFVKTFA